MLFCAMLSAPGTLRTVVEVDGVVTGSRRKTGFQSLFCGCLLALALGIILARSGVAGTTEEGLPAMAGAESKWT
jgi:hypothetical protein